MASADRRGLMSKLDEKPQAREGDPFTTRSESPVPSVSLRQTYIGESCRGQDSNLGTPARADLESAAFGRSATPAYGARGDRRPYSSSVSSSARSVSSATGMERAPSSRRSSRCSTTVSPSEPGRLCEAIVLRCRPHLRQVRTRRPFRRRVRTVRPSTQKDEQARQYSSRYSRRRRTLYRIPIRRAKATYRSASSGCGPADSRSASAKRSETRSRATRTMAPVRRPLRPDLFTTGAAGIPDSRPRLG